MSEPRSRRKDDEGGEWDGEPHTKQIKLDPEAQQLVAGEVPAPKVKIVDLPDLAIATILSFLSITELTEVTPNVCRQWRRVSQDPLIWYNKRYYVSMNHPEGDLVSTLRRTPQLRVLVMGRPVNHEVLKALCENCTHLTSLKVANSQQISYSLLNKLVMNCQNIQSLTIPDRLLVDQRKARILAQLERLKSLEVLETFIDDESVSIHLGPFGDTCPEFSKLDVSGKDQLCTEDLNHFIEGAHNSLKHLALPWLGKDERCVVPLMKDCTSLVNLELCDDSNRIGEILEACTALTHLQNLRSLSLFFWDDVSLADARAFKFGGLLHIEVLKINGLHLQNSVLVAIFECFPNLNELHLVGCFGLDDGDLKELCRVNNLQTLAINDCEGLNEKALLHVAQLPNLRKLLLDGCDFRDLKNGLHFLLEIRSLEMLSLDFIKYACLFHFDRIPETLINLRVLKVKGCEVDPRVLEQLEQQMPRLKVYSSCLDDSL